MFLTVWLMTKYSFSFQTYNTRKYIQFDCPVFFFFENRRNTPLFLSLSLSLSLSLFELLTLLLLIVECASLSLELSADIRDVDDDESCCNDNGRGGDPSNRVVPQPM